jgi:capsular polysaccharide biosynthesis protein
VSNEEGIFQSDARGSRSYGLVLRDRWPVLAITVITALATAAVLLQTLPKKYASEADLQVNPIQSSDDRFVGLGLLQESNESRGVLTIARFADSHQVARAVASKIGGKPNTLLAEVKAQPQGQSNIVTIEARAASPKRAADVANEFAKTVVAERTARFQQLLDQRIAHLNDRVAQLRAHGKASEAADTTQTIGFLSTYVGDKDPTVGVENAAVSQNRVVSPRKKLVLVVVALAALLLAGALLFALELLDPRVREERQVTGMGKPILARLPRMTRRAATHLLRGDRSLPGNAIAAYRLLADQLFDRGDGWLDEPTVVLVAGTPASLPEDNLAKTVTAVNLAALASSAGRQTIIVDADSRLDVNGSGPNLTDLLSGANYRDVMRPVPGSDGWLSVVPASPNSSRHRASEGPGGLGAFGRKAVAAAFEQLRSAADVVVVNAPAVADAAELIPLAKAADRIVIEVELGVTSQARLEELVKTFDEQDAQISGFVLYTRRRSRGTGGRLTYARTVARPTAAPQRQRQRPSVVNKPQSLETNG